MIEPLHKLGIRSLEDETHYLADDCSGYDAGLLTRYTAKGESTVGGDIGDREEPYIAGNLASRISSGMKYTFTSKINGDHMAGADFNKVHHIVRQVPSGKVVTYGQIAFWLGWPHGARTVGWAMRVPPAGDPIPWHRVLNAKGRISIADDDEQRIRLESEGIIFDTSGRIDLHTFQWKGQPHLLDS
jgi:methylated-DNA-protein-cysteine methyltransferase-like protein